MNNLFLIIKNKIETESQRIFQSIHHAGSWAAYRKYV